jgi:Raf kinase inhibitor-like YbhB/YbcL family protein
MSFSVMSPAFADGEQVPTQFTCDGTNTPPPLTVADPPQGTESFALIMEDPDAPTGTFTHWLAYDIPADDDALRPTAGKSLKNSFGRSGYGGPCPPQGHGEHRYDIAVYAVDVPALALRGDSRRDLEAALKEHTLAEAHMTGRYARANQPHDTTNDQISEMESEGQAAKPGQTTERTESSDRGRSRRAARRG